VFFAPFLNRHPNRFMIVLRTTDQFRNSSLSLPPIHVELLKCKGMQQHKLVDSILSPQINEMLHAGDISGALIQLGVPESTPMSLIEAVTLNQQKELRRLEATLEFKRGLEYSTAALKDAALAALEVKIKSLKDQIAAFERRIEEMDTESCAICYEQLSNTICVPCCKQLFCGGCIIELLKRNNSCPMCRAKINIKDLKTIKKAGGKGVAAIHSDAATATLLNKPEALLRLIQNNPTGKFIVFSRYENPFEFIETKFKEAGITVQQLKGNKDVIYSLIDRFREGAVRVLLLNSEHFATGMNLEAASHVVLYHGNMSPNERHQIIGRAHRLGRTGPLTVVQMLHENETQ
jgi:SNF2 family DNA or RNA helicase